MYYIALIDTVLAIFYNEDLLCAHAVAYGSEYGAADHSSAAYGLRILYTVLRYDLAERTRRDRSSRSIAEHCRVL